MTMELAIVMLVVLIEWVVVAGLAVLGMYLSKQRESVS
jgi:hypothetical protein